MSKRAARWISLLGLILSASTFTSCNKGLNALMVITSDDTVQYYRVEAWESKTKVKVLDTGFSQLTHSPFKVGLTFKLAGDYIVRILGASGNVDITKDNPYLGADATEFFYITRLHVDGSLGEVPVRLLKVPSKHNAQLCVQQMDMEDDDCDQDLWPDPTSWFAHSPEAARTFGSVMDLLDCDDKIVCDDKHACGSAGMNTSLTPVDPAAVHPFAKEICGDGVDEDCGGNSDEACVDSDGDGDPDGTDCAPNDPKIHHPQLDKSKPTYDPIPQSANCCPYNLMYKDPATGMPVMVDPMYCHKDTCDNGIIEDCSGADVPCFHDQDCDGYAAAAKMDTTCMAPPNVAPPGNDCNDCDPSVKPGAAEICGNGKDDNCNGLTDEGCVSCDLDGDGYQRMDSANGCPDKSYDSTKGFDCNDEDSGVFPGSTKTVVPLPYLPPSANTCGGKEGGSVSCALRGACRNPDFTNFTHTKIDGAVQDTDCDGKPSEGCPPMTCDADGDGFVPQAKLALPECAAFANQLGGPDSDDTDPHTFPLAPEKCGDGKIQDSTTPTERAGCSMDSDHDGYADDQDCAPMDPARHPWAVELCNGLDDDCDGLTDEGNPDPSGVSMTDPKKKVVIACNDSNVGECGTPPHAGDCVCSSTSVSNNFFTQSNRMACPGETATVDGMDSTTAKAGSRCYFAYQPKPQQCTGDPKTAKDDNCDGAVDDPMGTSFPDVGKPCWPGAPLTSQCLANSPMNYPGGKITGCKQPASGGMPSNCFAAFGVSPSVNPWYTCDTAAACPVKELCNGFDDDCNGMLPVSEQDLDGDHYLACGSPFAQYKTDPSPCQTKLAPGILGCGDCADMKNAVVQVAGGPAIKDETIHPKSLDVCDGVDNDCDPGTLDGAGDCMGPRPAQICCPTGTGGDVGCRDNANGDSNSVAVKNCGGCNMVCSLANATPACTNSVCSIMGCSTPYADCDTVASNGCEINLSTDATHCGGCTKVCSSNHVATPSCSNSVCNGNCSPGYLDCNSDKLTDGCEINILGDPNNCGSCSTLCSNNHIATPTCTSGLCTGACGTGFLDCNANKQTDGCETSIYTDAANCGGCGTACSKVNITAACSGTGQCTGTCSTGFDNCDNTKRANGCNVSLFTDATNCGGCAKVCSSNHVPTPACSMVTGAGKCTGACAAGYLDCDSDKLTNGCEINGQTDPVNCGGCTMACNSTTNVMTNQCTAGNCTQVCNAGFDNCDNTKRANGCNVNLNTTPTSCGGCGMACSSTNVMTNQCTSGSCSQVCNAGFDNCDNTRRANGCNVNLNTSVANCGGCAMACSATHVQSNSCTSGNCSGMCATGFMNCNGSLRANGCNVSIYTDANNCGACGTACSTTHITAACTGTGQCTGTCQAGFANCDGTKQANGCNCDLSTHACSGGACKLIVGQSGCTGDSDCVTGLKCCTGTCIDPTSNASNCGGCGTSCSAATAGTACVSSSCGCNAFPGDCNTNISSQCVGVCKCGASAACSAATQRCVGSGGSATCKLIDGQTCTTPSATSTECASGFCSKSNTGGTNYCTTTNCALTTCNVGKSDGSCEPVSSAGADPYSQCTTSCKSGCNGTSTACRAATNGISCGTTCTPSMGCVGECATATTNASCSSGSCSAGSVACAGNVGCASSSACNSPTCTKDADCVQQSGKFSYCASGTCTQRQNNGNGSSCANDQQCYSDACVSTKCTDCNFGAEAGTMCSPATAQCNSLGGCVACANGTPGNNQCSAGGFGASCMTGACACTGAGAGDCTNPRTDTCTASTCVCGSTGSICPTGQFCVSGACKMAPNEPCQGGDCASGSCTSGVCPKSANMTGSCVRDSDCNGGHTCVMFKCSA